MEGGKERLNERQRGASQRGAERGQQEGEVGEAARTERGRWKAADGGIREGLRGGGGRELRVGLEN